MAKVERDMNVAILKKDGRLLPDGKKERVRVFLDTIPEDEVCNEKEMDIQCGIMCQGEFDEMEDCDE